MSKLRPQTHEPIQSKRSWGSCFVIVCEDDGMRYNCHIEAYNCPSQGQIRAAAEAAVWRYKDAYRKRYHWEPPEPDRGMKGHLRGQAALAEAKRIILDDPATSPGQRFLMERQKLADRMGLPPEPKRNEYATNAMLVAVERVPGQEG